MSLLAIYLIGALLSFARVNASFYEIDEKYPDDEMRWYTYTPAMLMAILMTLFSWLGFITGVLTYFYGQHKYFFKWAIY